MPCVPPPFAGTEYQQARSSNCQVLTTAGFDGWPQCCEGPGISCGWCATRHRNNTHRNTLPLFVSSSMHTLRFLTTTRQHCEPHRHCGRGLVCVRHPLFENFDRTLSLREMNRPASTRMNSSQAPARKRMAAPRTVTCSPGAALHTPAASFPPAQRPGRVAGFRARI